jgi:hypothetical protein
MITPLAVVFESLLTALVWAVWFLLNFWIWSKSKSNGNLLMMVGAGVMTVMSFLFFVEVYFGGYFWMQFIALLVLTAGFYLSVKPMVAAQLAALQAKMKNIGHHGGGGAAPSGGGDKPAS